MSFLLDHGLKSAGVNGVGFFLLSRFVLAMSARMLDVYDHSARLLPSAIHTSARKVRGPGSHPSWPASW